MSSTLPTSFPTTCSICGGKSCAYCIGSGQGGRKIHHIGGCVCPVCKSHYSPSRRSNG